MSAKLRLRLLKCWLTLEMIVNKIDNLLFQVVKKITRSCPGCGPAPKTRETPPSTTSGCRPPPTSSSPAWATSASHLSYNHPPWSRPGRTPSSSTYRLGSSPTASLPAYTPSTTRSATTRVRPPSHPRTPRSPTSTRDLTTSTGDPQISTCWETRTIRSMRTL